MNSKLNKSGWHVLLDMKVSRLETITASFWASLLAVMAKHFGMNALGRWSYDFSTPGACSSGVILGTSHASIHTWPERDYVALDLFSCGEADITLDEVVQFLKNSGIEVIEAKGSIIERMAP